MKIKFGTTLDNVYRAMIVSTILFSFVYLTCLIHNKLDDAQKELYHSRMLNITSLNIRLFCEMSFDDCLCSVQSTKTKQSKYCLTDNFLFGSRIFLLVSFVLQIFVIHDLFSFSGKYVRFIVYGLWIVAVFIVIIIANGIYRDSCFHRFINTLFCLINILLFFLMFCDVAYNYDNDRLSRRECTSVNEQVLEKPNNDPISWQSLV
jgi:hypothetical protein